MCSLDRGLVSRAASAALRMLPHSMHALGTESTPLAHPLRGRSAATEAGLPPATGHRATGARPAGQARCGLPRELTGGPSSQLRSHSVGDAAPAGGVHRAVRGLRPCPRGLVGLRVGLGLRPGIGRGLCDRTEVDRTRVDRTGAAAPLGVAGPVRAGLGRAG